MGARSATLFRRGSQLARAHAAALAVAARPAQHAGATQAHGRMMISQATCTARQRWVRFSDHATPLGAMILTSAVPDAAVPDAAVSWRNILTLTGMAHGSQCGVHAVRVSYSVQHMNACGSASMDHSSWKPCSQYSIFWAIPWALPCRICSICKQHAQMKKEPWLIAMCFRTGGRAVRCNGCKGWAMAGTPLHGGVPERLPQAAGQMGARRGWTAR